MVVVGLENRSELRIKSEMLARVPLYLLTLPSLRLQQGSTPSSRLFDNALRLSPYAKEIVMLIRSLQFRRKNIYSAINLLINFDLITLALLPFDLTLLLLDSDLWRLGIAA